MKSTFPGNARGGTLSFRSVLYSSLFIVLFSSCATSNPYQSDKLAARDREKGNFVVTKDGRTFQGEHLRKRAPLIFGRSHVEVEGQKINTRDIRIFQDDRAYYYTFRNSLVPRVQKGNINTYLDFESSTSIEQRQMPAGGPMTTTTTTRQRPIYYVQKTDSGELVLKTHRAVNEMVMDYAPAMEFMDRFYRTKRNTTIWSIVNTAAVIGGAALAVTTATNGKAGTSATIGVGLLVGGMGSGFVNKWRKATNYRNVDYAIDEYNRKRVRKTR